MDKMSADLLKTADSLSGHMNELLATVKDFTDRFREMQNNLTATSETVQRRVAELDAFLGETTDSARLQVARIQQTVDNATRRVEDTLDVLHRRALAPINELNAVITGIRVGLDVLTGRRKRPVNPSRQDEEMFI
jgi:ABC-type transporter Mla subunit MlaD